MIDNADDPLRCFYRIWTVREAFSKEEGIGLSLFENEQPEIGYNSGTVNYRGKTLYFNVWEKDGHSVCVCGSYGRILEKTIDDFLVPLSPEKIIVEIESKTTSDSETMLCRLKEYMIHFKRAVHKLRVE